MIKVTKSSLGLESKKEISLLLGSESLLKALICMEDREKKAVSAPENTARLIRNKSNRTISSRVDTSALQVSHFDGNTPSFVPPARLLVLFLKPFRSNRDRFGFEFEAIDHLFGERL